MPIYKGVAHAAEAALRLASEIANIVKQFPGLTGDNEPLSDPLNAQISHLLSLSITSTVEFGVIVDYVPHCQAYRVLPEGADAPILCCRMQSMPTTMIGVTDADTLQVFTSVFFIRHQRATYGIIIGVEPTVMRDARRAMGDAIEQGSNCGLQKEPAHQVPFRLGPAGTNGGIHDWSSRNPGDSLEIGEFVRVSETGLMLSMDSYMAQLRVDEMCGLWMYYWDQLLRIAGTNFQLWTSASELESLDDEGEHFWYHGISPYPWEHRGILGPPQNVASELNPDLRQLLEPWYARLEPEFDDCQPFHRLQRHAGYIGQGEQRLLCAPGTAQDTTQRFSHTELQHTGLFEEVLTMSGRWGVRTATGMTIGKRPVIVVPKRIKTATDTKGDNPSNYQAAGLPWGIAGADLTETKLKPAPDAPSLHPSLAKVAGVLDLHTYLFNWEAKNAFHRHEKDYYLPEETEYEKVEANQEQVQYSDLQTDWYLDPPTPVDVQIDHREGNTTQVYPNQSYLTFLDDGGVVLGDGFGSELSMTGGNIRISAPGDIFLEGGRNVMGWAGRDVILRARNSADITCSNGDFRAKAEKNVQIIGGNGGGAHGIMMDCRGTSDTFNFSEAGEKTQHGGIVFRSESAPIVGWSSDIYWRSINSGTVTLDADKGRGVLRTHSSQNEHFVSTSSTIYYGTEGNIRAAHEFGEFQVLLCSSLAVGGNAGISGTLVVESHISALGSISDDDGTLGSFQSGKGPQLAALLQQQFDQVGNYCDQVAAKGKANFSTQLEAKFYATGKAGNDSIVASGRASLRTPADYLSESYVLFESRWAREARETEQSLPKWTEKPVLFGGVNSTQQTWPFPGGSKMEAKNTFFTQDAAMHTPADGLSKSRDELADEPKLSDPDGSSILSKDYLVIG